MLPTHYIPQFRLPVGGENCAGSNQGILDSGSERQRTPQGRRNQRERTTLKLLPKKLPQEVSNNQHHGHEQHEANGKARGSANPVSRMRGSSAHGFLRVEAQILPRVAPKTSPPPAREMSPARFAKRP